MNAKTDTQPWKITKISNLTGITHTLEIPMTGDQLARYVANEENVQNIFPELTADLREFLITGITTEEWDNAFSDLEDDCLTEWEELGEYYGYPQCCIDSFEKTTGMLNNPKGGKAGNQTGFIPCPVHAELILSNVITLESLIHNRQCKTPFPTDDMDRQAELDQASIED